MLLYLIILAASVVIGLTITVAAKEVRGADCITHAPHPIVIASLAAVAFLAYVHYGFSLEHRIYFDEDAYVNIAANSLSNRIGSLTLSVTPSNKQTVEYKWPVAFPVLMSPMIRIFGPERGPVSFNELCSVATVILVMSLAVRIAGRWFAAPIAVAILCCQPTAIAWYRSGSSDPLAVLLALLAITSAYVSRSSSSPYSLQIAVIALGLALHTRLECIFLVLPVALLLWPFDRHAWNWLTVGCLALSAGLACYTVIHYLRMNQFYLNNIPDSSFSLSYVILTLKSNLSYLVSHVPISGAVLLFAPVSLLLLKSGRSSVATMLSYPLATSVLLLFYSVGQYQAPGETRFLLPPLVSCSAIVAGCIASRLRLGTTMAICALLVVATGAARVEYRREVSGLQQQWDSVRQEHDAIRLWASEIPTGSIVVSRLPYLWENFGVYSSIPELNASTDSSRPLFLHIGLVDGGQNWPAGAIPFRKVMTEHGAICLFRLR
jgi:hypothetical protein